jgi:hypothetical protein
LGEERRERLTSNVKDLKDFFIAGQEPVPINKGEKN